MTFRIAVVNHNRVGQVGCDIRSRGVQNLDRLRYSTGISAPVKHLVGTEKLALTVVQFFVCGVRDCDGIYSQVAVGYSQTRSPQAAHCQRVGQVVTAIDGLVYRIGCQCIVDNWGRGVAHGDLLSHLGGTVTTLILKRVYTVVTPLAPFTSIRGVTLRDRQHRHTVAILKGEIRQLKRRIGCLRTVIPII